MLVTIWRSALCEIVAAVEDRLVRGSPGVLFVLGADSANDQPIKSAPKL